MRMRLVGAVMAIALVTSACSFTELLDFIETTDGGNTDLSQSEETAPAAASVPAKSADEEAQAGSETALETKDPDDVTRAVEARPHDPRYLIQRAVERMLDGDIRAMDDISQARGLSNANHAGKAEDEQNRRWTETVIETSHKMINSYGEGTEEREKLVTYYCDNLSIYASLFGHSFEGMLFLQFANTELCSDRS